MKKLQIFERVDYGDSSMEDSVTIKIKQNRAIATWKWQEDFDVIAHSTFFDCFRDIIMDLDAPFIGYDEAKRMFLWGCSLGNATGKCENPFDVDIMDFVPIP